MLLVVAAHQIGSAWVGLRKEWPRPEGGWKVSLRGSFVAMKRERHGETHRTRPEEYHGDSEGHEGWPESGGGLIVNIASVTALGR